MDWSLVIGHSPLAISNCSRGRWPVPVGRYGQCLL